MKNFAKSRYFNSNSHFKIWCMGMQYLSFLLWHVTVSRMHRTRESSIPEKDSHSFKWYTLQDWISRTWELLGAYGINGITSKWWIYLVPKFVVIAEWVNSWHLIVKLLIFFDITMFWWCILFKRNSKGSCVWAAVSIKSYNESIQTNVINQQS